LGGAAQDTAPVKQSEIELLSKWRKENRCRITITQRIGLSVVKEKRAADLV
jgi:hypothetical protein